MVHHLSPDRAAARIAAAQHGLITLAQAIGCGLSRRAIEHRLSSGRWEAVHRGVYRLAGAPRTWHQQALAACLAARGVACGRTAATLHRFDGVRASDIEVAVVRSRCPRRVGICVRRVDDLPPSDVARIDGIPVTSAARTIRDLAAVLPVQALEAALDDAIRRRLVKVRSLRPRVKGRGSRALRILLDQRSDRGAVSGSILETAFLRVIRGAGLPEPRKQWPVKRGGRVVAIVDFAYPEQRLAIEIDGHRFHSGRRERLRDLARQNEIVACGYDVLRFTSTDIEERADEMCARVAIMLTRGKG